MNLRSILLSAALAAAALASAQAGPSNNPKSGGAAPTQLSEPELYMGGFDGIWVGKLHQIDGAAVDPRVGVGKPDVEWEHALFIAGTSVKVMFRAKDKWSEVKPGAFRIVQHKTNATVFAIDSANDVYDKTGSGGWVESWTYTLSHNDAGTLYAGWWRAVNNYLSKPGEKNARFFMAMFGELRKVPSLPP